ncbi:MAG: hypothetical protein J2P49_04345 [Methylocapsa sp.]|nr:hypothetical protein [Methylocapsa sp.]
MQFLHQLFKGAGTTSSAATLQSLADRIAEPLRQWNDLGKSVHAVIPRPGQTIDDTLLRSMIEVMQHSGEGHGAFG